MKTPAMKLLSCLSVCFVWVSAAAGDIYIGPAETLQTTVDAGRIVNQGLAVGTIGEPLVFGPATRVQGGGEFVGTLSLGVFAPGNSPGVTTGTNQAFGASSIIEIELGGTLPGFSANNHDQIRDAATLALLGGKLSILPYNNFIPTVGNEFVVLTWQQGLVGSFGTMSIDPFFDITRRDVYVSRHEPHRIWQSYAEDRRHGRAGSQCIRWHWHCCRLFCWHIGCTHAQTVVANQSPWLVVNRQSLHHICLRVWFSTNVTFFSAMYPG